MGKRLITTLTLAASLALLAGSAGADNRRGHEGRGVVLGGGYATFDAGGAPGDNLYWVTAVGGPRHSKGRWYADVFIDFGGGATFDFEALYTVDCLFVKRSTKEAWIDGTIIESNDPANIGNRATLYIKDGGPNGDDFHGITPLPDGAPTCEQMPSPDFMELAQSGDYIIH